MRHTPETTVTTIKPVLSSIVFAIALVGCSAEPESLSYCADVEQVQDQVDCLDESFEFYSRLVDSSHDFVVETLQQEIDGAKNSGQQKKFERALEKHQDNYDATLLQLGEIQQQSDESVTLTGTVEANRVAIIEVEDDASILIHEFELACDKAVGN